MAAANSRHVIYIIIATQMKNSPATATAISSKTFGSRIHSLMAIVGIITAIICSLVLLQDAPQRAEAMELMPTSGISIANPITKVKDVLVQSSTVLQLHN